MNKGETFKDIPIKSEERVDIINITRQIQGVLGMSGVESGLAIIYCPHTTAAITINEAADPDVVSDIKKELNKIVPFSDQYQHLEGNSAAHIKSSLVGVSEICIIENGQIVLGRWQGIFFCEFDGPRDRKVYIKIIEG